MPGQKPHAMSVRRTALALAAIAVLVALTPIWQATAAPIAPNGLTGLGQQLAQPIVIVNTSFLNVRSGPGGIYSIIGTLPGGVQMPVLARNRDASWWQVQSPFGIGWVTAEFVIPRGDFRPVPVAEVTGMMDQPRAAVAGAPVTVYVLPDASSAMLGLALAGSQLPIVGATADGAWWQVQTNVGLGWVSQGAVALQGNGSVVQVVTGLPGAVVAGQTGSVASLATGERPVAYVFVETAQLLERPGSSDQTQVGELKHGDRVEVLSYSDDGRYALVLYMGGRMSWVAMDQVAISDPSDWRTQVYFYRTPTLDLKANPSNSAANTALVQGQTRLVMLDARQSEGAEWYLLSFSGGQGWAPSSTVDIIRNGPHSNPGTTATAAGLSGTVIQPSGAAVVTTFPSPARTIVIVNTSFLHVRSGPSASYTTVITLNGGTELNTDAYTPDGAWFRVSGAFGTGWVNAEFVIFRGDYSNLAIIRYQDAVGAASNYPVAIVSAPINVYRGVGIDSGLLGTAPAGLNLAVIGRSLDGGWLQVQTDIGAGWVLGSTVVLRGNAGQIPVTG